MNHITLSGDTVYALADSTASAAYYSNGVFGIGYPGIISDSLVINSGYVFALGKTGISGFKNVIINDGVITAIGKKADYGIKANKIIINGGSVKTTSLSTQAVNAKGEKVYCVTLPHNGVLSVGMNDGSKDTTLAFQAHHEDDANYYLYLPDGIYTFTCGSKQYKAVVSGSAVVAKELAVTAVAGYQSVDVSSLGFANADILTLISAELSDTTAAVIANGKIDFYAPAATTYSVSKKSTVTASLKTSIYPGTYNTTGLGGCNLTGYYKGKPRYYGTANEPITALTHFVGAGTKASGDVSSSWKALNTFIGLDQYGTSAITGGWCYILAEDRDETTGKLLASFYFDPSISVAGSDALKGPHVYNVIFNPTDSVITAALSVHSAYSGSTALQASALDSVKAVRDAENSMVIANVQFMRAFSTQAKTYTFDIATLSNGMFKTGDVLELKYLLGSYNTNSYHSGTSAATTALEANAQSKVDKDTVDADGYVKFNMYGGGFFSLKYATVDSFVVTFRNADADKSLLYRDTVAYDSTAVYGGYTPVLQATPEYSFTFKGWSAALSAIQGDLTVYALYDSTANMVVGEKKATLYSMKDNTIVETVDGSAANSTALIYVGNVAKADNIRRRGLVAFGTSVLPKDVVLDSVKLKLSVSSASTMDIELYKVKTNWTEGSSYASGGMGVAATPYDVTWLHASYSDSLWSTSGGDYDATMITSATLLASDTLLTFSGNELKEQVKAWIADSASNCGWLLKSSDETTSAKGVIAKFYSKETAPTLAKKPMLEIYYHSSITEALETPAAGSDLVIYPVPATDRVTISTTASIRLVKVLDLSGKTLLTGTDPALDVRSLSKGMYLMQVSTDKGLFTRQLIKR